MWKFEGAIQFDWGFQVIKAFGESSESKTETKKGSVRDAMNMMMNRELR